MSINQSMRNLVLIGGGSGFVGRNLTRQLLSDGFEVQWLVRKATAKSSIGQITWSQIEQQGLPEHVRSVVNLAGTPLMVPFRPWTSEQKVQLVSSRVRTTSLLRDVICRSAHPPESFVCCSGVNYYPPSATELFDEHYVAKPYDFLSQLTTDWEAAGQLPPGCPSRHVIVRLGVVLGRESGIVQNLFLPFFLGAGHWFGTGDQWLPWIHKRDAAGLFAHAVKQTSVTGVLNGVAPQHVTNRQFATALARAMNRWALFGVPAAALNLMFHSDISNTVLQGRRVVPERTLKSGCAFVFDSIDTACAEVAHWTLQSDEIAL